MAISSASFAQEGVDVGSFNWKGKSIAEKAVFLSADQVKFGETVIPWAELNPSIQFRLEPYREKFLAEEKLPKTFKVYGKVSQVLPAGCIVNCYEKPKPTPPVRELGGGHVEILKPKVGRTKATVDQTAYATGKIFIRGLVGKADSEPVDVMARQTEEVLQYPGNSGMRTARIYDLIPANPSASR